MSLCPGLTWLHLFPKDTALECPAGPAWLREALAGRRAGSRRALVTWGERFGDVSPRLGGYDGLVAVNGRSFSPAKLAAAGFGYVRRFAVLPSLERARWFIPLDSPTLSSAGFCLYTPARLSARLKLFAARVMTHTRLPLWYRDSIWVAQRTAPPIEAMFQSLFPGEDVRLALSSGAPEPARNRKVSVALLGRGGRVRAFAKMAASDLARRLVGHEADVLPLLNGRGAGAHPAPELLFAGEVDGTYLAVQTPLDGRATAPRLTPAHRQFLRSLEGAQRLPAAATPLVEALPGRIAALPQDQSQLRAILVDALPHLERVVVPVTIVHGDFAPWNLREHNGQIAAFDWEYAQPGGLPLLDEVHFCLQVGYLIDGWDARRAAEYLAAMAAPGVTPYAPEGVRALQVVYFLDQLVRLLAEGYGSENDMVTWYRHLLAQLADAPAVAAPTPAAEVAVV